jgi:hypothetical protein
MKERPILFSGPMVRAILEGRKTQTRRVMTPQPWHDQLEFTNCKLRPGITDVFADEEQFRQNTPQYCRHGVPGDRLWVKETWRPWGWREDNPITVQYQADGAKRESTPTGEEPNYEEWYERIAIDAAEECEAAACMQDDEGAYVWTGDDDCPIRWHPSIFLTRWCSRITLELATVRVQRLQEISADDVIAEGIQIPCDSEGHPGLCISDPRMSPHKFSDKKWADWNLDDYARFEYARLWESINAKRGFGWDKNPWVWAITFGQVTA